MDDEENILRVKGSSSPSSLAAAISHGVYDGRKPVLRAIGAGAVNQAAKAMAIASQYVAARGLTLYGKFGFATVTVPDGEVTAVIIRVIAM